jgi:hypothetical protein
MFTTEEEDDDDTCHVIYKIWSVYVERVLNSTGLVFNLLSMFVFIRLIRTNKAQGNMYKYLMFKSAFDAYCSLRNLAYIIYDCRCLGLNNSLALVYVYWIFIVYWGEQMQFMGILCELAACADRFKIVSNKLLIASSSVLASMLKRRPLSNYKIVLTLMFLFSGVMYSYKVFERKLNVRRLSNASNEYSLIFNSFGNSDASVLLDFINSLLMNFVSIVIILVLNVLTLVKTRKCLGKKKLLANSSFVLVNTTTQNGNNLNSNAKMSQMQLNARRQIDVGKRLKINRVEMNVSLMVFTTGLLAIFGHGLVFVYRLPIMVYSANFCFYSFANFVFTLSYVCNFLIYLVFLKNFRNCFFSIFARLRNVLAKLIAYDNSDVVVNGNTSSNITNDYYNTAGGVACNYVTVNSKRVRYLQGPKPNTVVVI